MTKDSVLKRIGVGGYNKPKKTPKQPPTKTPKRTRGSGA